MLEAYRTAISLVGLSGPVGPAGSVEPLQPYVMRLGYMSREGGPREDLETHLPTSAAPSAPHRFPPFNFAGFHFQFYSPGTIPRSPYIFFCLYTHFHFHFHSHACSLEFHFRYISYPQLSFPVNVCYVFIVGLQLLPCPTLVFFCYPRYVFLVTHAHITCAACTCASACGCARVLACAYV